MLVFSSAFRIRQVWDRVLVSVLGRNNSPDNTSPPCLPACLHLAGGREETSHTTMAFPLPTYHHPTPCPTAFLLFSNFYSFLPCLHCHACMASMRTYPLASCPAFPLIRRVGVQHGMARLPPTLPQGYSPFSVHETVTAHRCFGMKRDTCPCLPLEEEKKALRRGLRLFLLSLLSLPTNLPTLLPKRTLLYT